MNLEKKRDNMGCFRVQRKAWLHKTQQATIGKLQSMQQFYCALSAHDESVAGVDSELQKCHDPDPMLPHLKTPVLAAVRSIVHLLCHIAVASVIIIGMRALELLIQVLWRSHEPLLFGFLPLKYLVHAIDLGVLVVFGVYGIISVIHSFRVGR